MDQQWKHIAGLDLKKIRNKFSEKKSWWWHMGHSPARVENEYRQLLYLLASNPEKTVVPWSADVNDFWREHILDTTKYATDCHAVAGRLIHHHPHLVDGSPAYPGASADTRKLYLSTFGESARKKRRAEGGADFSSDTPTVLSDSCGHRIHSHHPGHHGAGQHAGGHHGGPGHSCGGHGHGCGGHSSCGGHGGH